MSCTMSYNYTRQVKYDRTLRHERGVKAMNAPKRAIWQGCAQGGWTRQLLQQQPLQLLEALVIALEATRHPVI